MSDNLAIWNALARTDPTHTKPFQRQGGFRGTAIKPIYSVQKMTEHFGPCGIGWGYEAPQFQIVPGPAGEQAVYCTVGAWFVRDGQRSAPVYGVGGDFAVKSTKNGLVADDEAFKKAFTDALTNALKHLGAAADVHMGLFDDSKYVAELRREFAEDGDAPPRQEPRAQASPPAPVGDKPNQWVAPRKPAKIDWPTEPGSKRDKWRIWLSRLSIVLSRPTMTPAELVEWTKANEAAIHVFRTENEDWSQELNEVLEDARQRSAENLRSAA